jgi:hypothetical protein
MTRGAPPGGPQGWPRRRAPIVQGLLLVSGLALLGGMVWQVGLAGLQTSLHAIGPWILPFLLLDSVSLWLHTVAWAACFPPGALPVSLWHLSLVRLAGSAVNWITPTASIGEKWRRCGCSQARSPASRPPPPSSSTKPV